MSLEDATIIAIAVIGFIVLMAGSYYYIFFVKAIYTTDSECTSYASKAMIIIDKPSGKCNWLVDKLIVNGSGYKLKSYIQDDRPMFEKFVLTQ